jgi:hypothetical protein
LPVAEVGLVTMAEVGVLVVMYIKLLNSLCLALLILLQLVLPELLVVVARQQRLLEVIALAWDLLHMVVVPVIKAPLPLKIMAVVEVVEDIVMV